MKFNDSDLIGIPFRVVVGKHAENGCVEWVERKSGGTEVLSVECVLTRITEIVNKDMRALNG
ncbi:Proline--tRNA ligase [compost metagenome]